MRAVLIALALLVGLPPACAAASIDDPLILVARPALRDALFEGAVLVVAPLGGDEHVGCGICAAECPCGAIDEQLRVVLTGALAVAKKADSDWMRLNTLTAGDLAGELAFLDSRPRHAALVALGPTKLLTLERAKLESLLETDPLLVYRVMRAIARFAHEVLHRSGWQIAQLTAYVYKTEAKY